MWSNQHGEQKRKAARHSFAGCHFKRCLWNQRIADQNRQPSPTESPRLNSCEHIRRCIKVSQTIATQTKADHARWYLRLFSLLYQIYNIMINNILLELKLWLELNHFAFILALQNNITFSLQYCLLWPSNKLVECVDLPWLDRAKRVVLHCWEDQTVASKRRNFYEKDRWRRWHTPAHR